MVLSESKLSAKLQDRFKTRVLIAEYVPKYDSARQVYVHCRFIIAQI